MSMHEHQADFDAASGADEEERARRMAVRTGQTWRRRSDGKLILVTGIGEWAGAENDGPFAFTCAPGEVDPSDGFVHDGSCCGWFVHIIEQDCELMPDGRPASLRKNKGEM